MLRHSPLLGTLHSAAHNHQSTYTLYVPSYLVFTTNPLIPLSLFSSKTDATLEHACLPACLHLVLPFVLLPPPTRLDSTRDDKTCRGTIFKYTKETPTEGGEPYYSSLARGGWCPTPNGRQRDNVQCTTALTPKKTFSLWRLRTSAEDRAAPMPPEYGCIGSNQQQRTTAVR